VRNKSVWEHACGLTRTIVEGVDFNDGADAVVVSVRPVAKMRSRCGLCGRRCPGYDRGEGRRRWRALDLGRTKVFLEAAAPRVQCRTHGVTVAAVPWARHDAGHTRDFDDLAAWLAVRTSKSRFSHDRRNPPVKPRDRGLVDAAEAMQPSRPWTRSRESSGLASRNATRTRLV